VFWGFFFQTVISARAQHERGRGELEMRWKALHLEMTAFQQVVQCYVFLWFLFVCFISFLCFVFFFFVVVFLLLLLVLL
jgi:hypothetical protein